MQGPKLIHQRDTSEFSRQGHRETPGDVLAFVALGEVYEAMHETAQAERAYGEAMGHVMRKHRFPAYVAAYHCARPLGGAGLDLVRGRPALARKRLVVAAGRLAGWRTRE